MTTIAFDVTAFRAMFAGQPVAATPPTDATLQMDWDLATSFIDDAVSGCNMLTGAAQVQALNLMTAHIWTVFSQVAGGDTPAILTDAAIDKVRVAVKAPNTPDQFSWWLNTTPYGAAVLALLNMVSVGGLYIGGLPERAAFRRVGGGFGGIPPRRGCC